MHLLDLDAVRRFITGRGGPTRGVREAARLMLDHRIGALPVVDGERLDGILTETDLVRAFAETPEPATR